MEPLFLQRTRLPTRVDDAVDGAKCAAAQLTGNGEAIDDLLIHFIGFLCLF